MGNFTSFCFIKIIAPIYFIGYDHAIERFCSNSGKSGYLIKCHGKKSDKETQSPMLKIFKDMMQKDKKDPEKINLLKDKQKEKRRKSYSESRSKADHRSYDSSSTDRCKKSSQAKIAVQDIPEDRNGNQSHDRSRSTAFRDERRESWWFWGDNREQGEKKPDDTCSCVSCALKKVVGSEYTCVACLLVLFTVSVVVAFLMVFKTMPVEDVTEKVEYGDNLVKKIQMLKEKRQLTESYGYDFTEKNKWHDSLVSSFANILGSEYSGNSFKGSNIMEEMNNGISEDLANILDNEKMMEGQNSERLKDFFKKLIETDVQIRKLKQAVNNNYQIQNYKADRFKRSLRSKRFKSKFSKNKLNLFAKNNSGNANILKDKKDNKRQVTGYVIKAEKFLIQYDKKRNFPKCSHDVESKSHEEHLKHPFYKHSQRIDDMLETYRKPETTTDNIKIKKLNTKLQIRSKDQEKSLSNTDEDRRHNYDQDVTLITTIGETKSVFDKSNDLDYLEKFLTTTPMYDVVSSASTFINPMDKDVLKSKLKRTEYTGKRKLMQVDEEEDQEELGYEDLKEVLTDNQEGHDDFDRNVERKKRKYEERFNAPDDINQMNHNPSNVLNQNWKRPMPLYPDELNAMINQAALQNLNFQIPVNTKDTNLEQDGAEKEISDTQYVEDYADNKYNKLVRMAQAYSDYGVLNNKNDNAKDNINEKSKWTPFNHIPKFNRFFSKHGFFERPKKGSLGEGFRFEIKPGNIPNEHEEFVKTLQKHIKVTNQPPPHLNEAHSTTLHPINFEDKKLVTPTLHIDNIPIKTNSDISNIKNKANSIIFTIRKGSRALKSIDMRDESFARGRLDSNTTNINHVNNTSDGIISFISIMSDWFKTLASLSGEIKIDEFREQEGNNSSTHNVTSNSKIKYLEENSTSEMLYPSYDLEMVDNIGHRSRVLTSFNEKYNTHDKPNIKNSFSKPNETKRFKKAAVDTEIDGVVPMALVLASNDTDERKAHNNDNKSNATKNTVIKRSVGDNSVFWNDLYDDDEYGVKLDYLDSVRDKHSINSVKNAIHRSKNWIQGKFKNITHKFKGRFRKKNKSTTKRKTSKTVKKPTKQLNNTIDPCEGIKHRSVRNADINEVTDIKSSFAALTANMKKVCQEAARAVQNTRNIEVRENTKENAAATSLMQQLVRMMSDLVDIQVQQKTCAKLPADLYNFLEWLTAPTDDNPQVDDLTLKASDYAAVGDDLIRFEKSTDSTQLTEDTHEDDRTECLGTIRAVQDLIQQYEGMSDEDKSKMTGVREYLENQLQYLNNKLNGIDDINLFKLYEKREIPRKRRDIHYNIRKENKNKIADKIDKTVNKQETVNENQVADSAMVKEKSTKKNAKRNLRNVYYKAEEEAKKTSVKDSREAFDKV